MDLGILYSALILGHLGSEKDLTYQILILEKGTIAGKHRAAKL